MTVRRPVQIPQKVSKSMSKFTAVLVDESQVEESKRGREAKPILADDFEALIFGTPVVRKVDGKDKKFENISAAIAAGHKSDWFAAGETSEVMIRSAAKYHGLSVNFGKTKSNDPIFRFAGVYKPRPRKDTAEK